MLERELFTWTSMKESTKTSHRMIYFAATNQTRPNTRVWTVNEERHEIKAYCLFIVKFYFLTDKIRIKDNYLTAKVDWSLWVANFFIVFGTPTVEIVIILCPICISYKKPNQNPTLAHLHAITICSLSS